MVPEVNYWKFDFNAVVRMVPVETPLGTPKARSRSVKARRSVTHVIKKRISVKYRAYNLDRRQPFSVNKSHMRLIHHFTMEYMVKGIEGLPVYKEQVDNSDTDEEYEMHVLTNYKNKSVGYEEVMRDKVTAENHSAYRACKECNAKMGSGQGYHKNSKTPKKRVTIKMAKPHSMNVSSPLGNQSDMQPAIMIERLQLPESKPPPKRRLFSSPDISPHEDDDDSNTITTVATIHEHSDKVPLDTENIVLAFKDL